MIISPRYFYHHDNEKHYIMNCNFNIVKVFTVFALTFCGIVQSYAQNLTNANPTYTQNFNTLISSGSTTWANNSTLSGWYHAAGTNTLIAGTGSGNSGSLYSFGSTGSSERALGSVASGSTDTLFYGVLLKNTGTSNITSITVTYTGEQWRNGSNAAVQSLFFAYSVTATAINTGAYTPLSALNFASPIHTNAAATSLDGNSSANKIAGITATITGLNIAPNSTIMLRWADPNDLSNDHGLAIDDLTATATFAVATAPVVTTTRTGNVSATSFGSGGNVTSNGGSTLTGKGVAWGNTTATSSQTSTSGATTGSYTTAVINLTPNTDYYYRAYATNTVGTSYGQLYDTTTLAAIPDVIADHNTTDPEHRIDVIIDENGNPGGTSGSHTTFYAIWESTTAQWVQANGMLGAAAVWQSYSSWSATVSGLEPGTQYCFQVKARNNDGLETALSASSCVTTAAATGTITGVSSSAVNTFCNGAAAAVTLNYTTTLSSGTYTAQLSNATGSFAAPVAIGTTTGASIAAAIPAGTTAGTGYRIRVVNGAVISDTTGAFTIKAAPAGSLSTAPTAICPGQEATARLSFTASGTAAGPFSLLIRNVRDNNTFSYTNISSGTEFSLDASQLPVAGDTQYQLMQITSSEGCINP